MKFALLIFACALAAASAQYSSQYNRNNQYDSSRFYKSNQSGQYNRYNRFNAFNRFTTREPFRPYVSPTPAPVVSSTYAPSTFAPISFAPSTAAPATVTPVPVVSVPRIVSDTRNAEIVKSGNEINPDGSFNYFYETSNGIAAQQEGVPRNFGGEPPLAAVVSQGSFSYTSPEGVPILITYTADENGFQPSGAVLPTSPPLPAQIARALEYNAKYYKV